MTILGIALWCLTGVLLMFAVACACGCTVTRRDILVVLVHGCTLGPFLLAPLLYLGYRNWSTECRADVVITSTGAILRSNQSLARSEGYQAAVAEIRRIRRRR